MGYVSESPLSTGTAYKQFLWIVPLHSGVADVTETAYMWYLESTDFAFIMLCSFCGNFSTRVVKQVPQILLIHPIISEHAAIDFQPTAQARTACTKTFCLRAQRLWSVEKN